MIDFPLAASARGALLAGAVIGTVGGLVAWLLFTSGVVRRARRVEENARRLHQQLPLLPPPAGADELGRAGQSLVLIEQLMASKDRTVRQNADLYRTLASSFPDGAVSLFNWELRFLVADGPALAAQGLSREHLEGRTLWEAFPPDTTELMEHHYRAALAGEEAFAEVPLGGRLFDLHVIPIRNEDGEVVVGMSIMQDVTDRRWAEP